MLAIQAQAGPTLPQGNSTLWQLKTPALYEQFSTRMHSFLIQMKLFESLKKGPFTQFVFKGRFLVPKIGSRRSDGPISRFRFCDENVGRSFVVCSHDPIFRTNKKSSIWCQNDHSDIVQNLSAPFIFQDECLMKIEQLYFYPFFSKLWIRVLEDHFQCVHTIRFSELTKNLQFGAKTITVILCKICLRLSSFKTSV